MRAVLKPLHRALQAYSTRSDFAWRYLLNLRSTLLHELHKQPPQGEGLRVLRALNRDGIAITSVSALFGGDDNLKELKAAVDRLKDDLADRLATARAVASDPDAKGEKPFVIRLLGETAPLLADDALRTNEIYLRYPLQDPIPRIVDAYFGMCALLHDYNVWYNFATRLPPRQSQLWHRDPAPEDRYVLKVFTCLTDVDEGNGPLIYAASTHLKGRVRSDPDYLHKDGLTAAQRRRPDGSGSASRVLGQGLGTGRHDDLCGHTRLPQRGSSTCSRSDRTCRNVPSTRIPSSRVFPRGDTWLGQVHPFHRHSRPLRPCVPSFEPVVQPGQIVMAAVCSEFPAVAPSWSHSAPSPGALAPSARSHAGGLLFLQNYSF